MSEKAICGLCGEPMPPGEEMFTFHGYSGPCPKPPKPKVPADAEIDRLRASNKELLAVCERVASLFADAKYPHSVESRLRDMALAAIAKAKEEA